MTQREEASLFPPALRCKFGLWHRGRGAATCAVRRAKTGGDARRGYIACPKKGAAPIVDID